MVRALAALPLLVLHRAEVHLHVRVARLEALLVLRLRLAHAVAPLGGLDGLVYLVGVRVGVVVRVRVTVTVTVRVRVRSGSGLGLKR